MVSQIKCMVVLTMVLNVGIIKAVVKKTESEPGLKTYKKDNLECTYSKAKNRIEYMCRKDRKWIADHHEAVTYYTELECEWCSQENNKTKDTACGACPTK